MTATCPFPGCLTTIPLDGRQGCYFHLGGPKAPVMSQSLLVRPCVCGGVIDARRGHVADAVRRHQGTSGHMAWALGLPLASHPAACHNPGVEASSKRRHVHHATTDRVEGLATFPGPCRISEQDER